MENNTTPQFYNVIVGMEGCPPYNFGINSHTDLVQEYKDAVLGDKKFFTWKDGCIEMKNVLGVFI